MEEKVSGSSMESRRRASREKSSDERLSRCQRSCSAVRAAFVGDARDIAIGLVQLAHDLVVVHRIGIARQDGKDFAERGLLAVQLVDQAVGEGLLAHQVVGVRLNGLDTANADDGRGHQQHDHQGEAGQQDPEDILVGDLPR